MSANRKPRKAYRPRPVLVTPLTYGASTAMLLQLGLRDRAAIDAIMSGDGDIDQLRRVEAACIAAIYLHRAGTANPAQHQVDLESLAEMGPTLTACAQAIRDISDRHERTGRVLPSGPDRAQLVALIDCLDALREAMPRRMWNNAYEEAIRHPTLRIPRPQPEREAA